MKERQSPDGTAWQMLTSGAVEIIDRAHLQMRVERGDHLRVKLGLDPTRPDLHIGHTVVLRALRRYQERGHTAVLIIGDWTARIGDPSGQSLTRPQLTRQQVNEAAKTYLDQVWKILDRTSTEVRRQSEWFDKMSLEDVVGLLSKYTVARMLAREDFAKRTKEGRPVGLHELLYPLLQAYDSVAVKADLELGGTDQTFNLLVGRDIQEASGQRPQDIHTMPLLEGLDGVQKMSKSLDNYIGIDEPADTMYGKAMSVPDRLIVRYLRLLTNATENELREIDTLMERGSNPRDFKMQLAQSIVEQFHGDDAAEKAALDFRRRFQDKQQPDDVNEVDVDPDEQSVSSLFLEAHLVSSKTEARRLVAQRGLYINNEPITDPEMRVTPKAGWVLKRGNHRFARLRLYKG